MAASPRRRLLKTPGEQVREQVRELKDDIRSLLNKVSEKPDEEKVDENLDVAEAKLASEIEIESLKLELASTRMRLRKLERNSEQCDIFIEYEREIEALRRNCASLRARNVKLEQILASRECQHAPQTNTLNSKYAKVTRTLETQIVALEKENANLRHSLRSLPLAERVAKANLNLAAQRAVQIKKLQAQLQNERNRNENQNDAIANTKLTIETANAHINQLQLERDEQQKKISALRDYIQSLPILHDAVAHILRD